MFDTDLCLETVADLHASLWAGGTLDSDAVLGCGLGCQMVRVGWLVSTIVWNRILSFFLFKLFILFHFDFSFQSSFLSLIVLPECPSFLHAASKSSFVTKMVLFFSSASFQVLPHSSFYWFIIYSLSSYIIALSTCISAMVIILNTYTYLLYWWQFLYVCLRQCFFSSSVFIYHFSPFF